MKIYDVELTLINQMLGTVPKNRDVYTRFIESKRPPEVEGTAEIATVVDENSGWDGFHMLDGHPIVYDYFIRGFIRHAGNVIKDFPEVKIKNLRSKITDLVFISPRIIMLGDNPEIGVCERPIRCQTAQGPRVSVKKSDTVPAGTVIQFQVKVLNENIISKKLLEQIFDYGQYQGLGEWRNGGHGTFSYKLNETKYVK
jgi:hypothetical protein